jgi:hypothetical protein
MPFDGSGFRAPHAEMRPPPSRGRYVSSRQRPAWTQLLTRLSPGRIGCVVLLKRARALVAREDAWVQGHYSGDGTYCVLGALLQADGRRHTAWFREAALHLSLVAKQRGFSSIEDMNDRCAHAEMLHAFDAAVALAWGHVP